MAIFVFVRHVFDILDETHRRVFVCVGCESFIPENFEKLVDRIGAVFVVFTENREGLSFVVGFGIFQMLETVGFDLQNPLEILRGKQRVVNGPIVGGVGVGLRARLFHDGIALFGSEILTASKHHVLEEMSETAFTRLNFISGTGPDNNVKGDKIFVLGRDGDEGQPVGEFVCGIRIGKKLIGIDLSKPNVRQQNTTRDNPKKFHAPSFFNCKPKRCDYKER